MDAKTRAYLMADQRLALEVAKGFLLLAAWYQRIYPRVAEALIRRAEAVLALRR